jgi:hypothetical protein
MHLTIFHAIIPVLLAVIAILWFRNTNAAKTTPGKCDCSDAIEEGYDMGYIDGFNLTSVETPDDTMGAKETFYDYENDDGDGHGKKYQQRTGSKFVSPVGGQCPRYTTMVKSGKWKGKCQRSMDWYKVYRGQSSDGKLFTCQGGRVASKDGKSCVCDASGGKVWNGSKCVCDKSKGLKWDSKTRRCRDEKSGKSAFSKSKKPETKKPEPKKSEPKKPEAKPATTLGCVYSPRVATPKGWVCPDGMIDTGLNWGDIDGGTKQCRTPACPQPLKKPLPSGQDMSGRSEKSRWEAKVLSKDISRNRYA